MTIEYTQQASPITKIHSISTPWPFWTGILSQVSKNDDEKNHCFLE